MSLKDGYMISHGQWMVKPPGAPCWRALMPEHHVEMHSDGTVTVTPSIMWNQIPGDKRVYTWHGYLEKGVFRSA